MATRERKAKPSSSGKRKEQVTYNGKRDKEMGRRGGTGKRQETRSGGGAEKRKVATTLTRERGHRPAAEPIEEPQERFREIRAVDLRKAYGQRPVVNGVSLHVREGEVVGLLGPNGAGKTTTFYMIVGLARANAGHVYINNVDVTKSPIHRRAQMGLGYLAQEPSVFRKLTVQQNIQAVLEMTGVRGAEQKRTIDRLLKEFDIEDVRHQQGYTLSGGERRRTEIARTLATNPSFILLDEPFTGVEPIAVEELQQIIRSLKERGIGLLMTDHSVRDTFEITDRSYILDGGKIVTAGTPSELMRDPIARKVYLGERFH